MASFDVDNLFTETNGMCLKLFTDSNITVIGLTKDYFKTLLQLVV